VLVALCLAISSKAAAQPPPTPQPQPSTPAPKPEDPIRLKEDVQVTATRSAVDKEMSPASSSVVLRTAIERRNVVAVDQALTTEEGVYAYRQRGITDNEVGIGMRGFSGRANGQSRVLILLDGQPLNNGYSGAVNWTALPLGEIDRVEVVRGPFSSLYGGNAMGGVVNVMTRPIERRSAELNAQYGTFDTLNVSGRASARFFGRLGLGVGYEALNTGGYRTQEVLRPATDSTPAGGLPVTGIVQHLTRVGAVNYAVGLRGRNTYDRDGVRTRAEYTFGPRTFGSFQYLYQANRYGWGAYESSVRSADGHTVDSGSVVFQDAGAWKRVTLAPSNYLGVVLGGSSHVVQGQLLHSTAGRGDLRAQGGMVRAPNDWNGAPGSAATRFGGPGNYTSQQNSGAYGNVQWSSVVRQKHALSVGVDVRLDRATIAVAPTTNYLVEGASSPRDTFSAGRAATWALYAQDGFSVTDNLQVTFGGRFDYWQTYDGASQKAASLPTEPFADRSDAAATGKLAVVYRPRPGTVLRTSVGTAFRSPSVFDLYRDVRLTSGRLLLGNPALDPERLKSWEVGLRQSAGGGAHVDVAYYENRIRSLILRSADLTSDPTGVTSRMFNAGGARTRGVELGATLRPLSWLTVRPTYTFTDAVIVRNDPAPLTIGKQVTFVPRHVAAGTVSTALRKLVATATGRYQSAVFATDTNTDTTRHVPGSYDDFFELDLALNYQLARHLSLNVTAENVLDSQHYLFYRNPGRVVRAGVRLRY
jgi:iron complex outermembrane receptor protein